MEMVTSVLESAPAVMYIPPPCQTRNVLTFGQFREVSSRGRRKKVPGRFLRQARTLACEVIKEMIIDGKIRSSEVSSW